MSPFSFLVWMKGKFRGCDWKNCRRHCRFYFFVDLRLPVVHFVRVADFAFCFLPDLRVYTIFAYAIIAQSTVEGILYSSGRGWWMAIKGTVNSSVIIEY